MSTNKNNREEQLNELEKSVTNLENGNVCKIVCKIS